MGVWLGPTIGKMIARGYSFSGQSEYKESGENWEIALKTSGTFRFKAKVDAIDIFLVGGGSDGGEGTYESETASARGGTGGNGGAYKTESNVSVSKGTDYAIVIGSAGQNSTMTCSSIGFVKTSSGGTVKSGGAGAGASHNSATGSYAAGGGTNGTKAFGESGTLIGGNTIYASSGAGGAAASASGSNYVVGSAGTGGTGAGSGGTASPYDGGSCTNGSAAITPGSGGGGAGAYEKNYARVTAGVGAGAPGIIIIRNHRSS